MFFYDYKVLVYIGVDSSSLFAPHQDEIKDGQWLGVSVRSQGTGGIAVVCAHRYYQFDNYNFDYERIEIKTDIFFSLFPDIFENQESRNLVRVSVTRLITTLKMLRSGNLA